MNEIAANASGGDDDQCQRAGRHIVHRPGGGLPGLLFMGEIEQVVIGCTLFIVAKDLVGAQDLPEFLRGVGIPGIEIGMGSLDGTPESGTEFLCVVARQRSEQIVQRLHSRTRRYSYPYTLPKLAAARSDRENHALILWIILFQDGKKMTELCTLPVTTGTRATSDGVNGHKLGCSAPACGLQQAKPFPNVPFGLLVAPPFIFDLEPRPSVRVEGLQLQPAERAIGRLWRGE